MDFQDLDIKGTTILSTEKNREFLEKVKHRDPLNFHQLLGLAETYHKSGNVELANKMRLDALSQFVNDESVDKAINPIRNTEIAFSIFGDAWDAIKEIFDGDEGKPNKCKYKCIPPFLLKKCAGDDPHWDIVGVCFGGRF